MEIEKRNLENLQFRVFIMMTKYLSLRDLLTLSQVSKLVQKNVSKCLMPLLRPHFDIKSYIEKYPYKALRKAMNRKVWSVSNMDLDFLLAKRKFELTSGISVKNNSKSQKQQNNKKGGKVKKSKRKYSKNNSKNKKKKFLSILPGICVTEVNSALKFIAFMDSDRTAYILDSSLFGKYTKYKTFNMSATIPNVVKAEYGSTMVYQDKSNTLFYLDTKTWASKPLKENLAKREVWSTGYLSLMIVTPNPQDGNYILSYYSDYNEDNLEPEHQSEIDFEVVEVTVAKTYFYLITKDGEIYQGEIGKFVLEKISSTAKKPKRREVFNEKVVNPKIIYPSNYQGMGFDVQNDEDIMEEKEDIDEYEKASKALKVFSNTVNSFICLSDSQMKKTKEMDRYEMAEFFTKIGLGEFSKLVLFQKVNGERLMKFDERDLEDNLGMGSMIEQNHLMLNVNQRRFDCWKEPELNVWGFNGNLELGIRTGVKTISVPHKLDITLDNFKDTIEEVKMRGAATIIRSKLKKFFIAWEIQTKFDEDGNIMDEEEEEIEEKVDEDNQLQSKFKNKKKKSKRKKSKKIVLEKKKGGKKFEKNKWRELNSLVEQQHPGYEIEDISTMKKEVKDLKSFINFVQKGCILAQGKRF